jgi:hypothetical protein
MLARKPVNHSLLALAISGFVLILSVACGPGASPPASSETLSVEDLELRALQLDGEMVRVEGPLVGFHEWMMFDGDRLQPKRYVQIRFPQDIRARILSEWEKYSDDGDVRGLVVLHGRFNRAGGRLLGEPGRIVQQGEPNSHVNSVVVDVITVDELLEFVPQVTSNPR